MISLNTLFPDLNDNRIIKGLAVDSRKVAPGFLFAALPGTHADGRKFVAQAVKAGAVAILAPEDREIEDAGDARVIYDANPRQLFAALSARFYDAQPECIAAVTGTNGKSSVVTFVRQIWALLDKKAASVGTLGVSAPDLNISGGLTTPDAAGLHERLSELHEHGVTHLAMEASSHGLTQYRMDGAKVSIAAFTNLSRDHLDYHATMEEYFSAKSRLFRELLEDSGTAVLNADCAEYQPLKEICDARKVKVISYGQAAETIKLVKIETFEDGQHLELRVDHNTYRITLPLAGYFQVENVMCALGIVMASGFAAKKVVPLLEKLEGVPGRMELIGGSVYVDYAHTPDALATVLRALRPHTKRKLIVVFGCGGDRDAGKRPEMGKVAFDHSDLSYVTDDNPRSEDPALIREAILATCPDGVEIADRKEAILTAMQNMKQGDVLLIAGKGHETGQIVGDTILPFDDRELVKEALNG